MNKIQAHANTHNEGGYGYNPAEHADRSRVDAIIDARMANLISRAAEVRDAWNAAIAAHTVDGQVRAADMPKIERLAGVTKMEVMDLKARGAFAGL